MASSKFLELQGMTVESIQSELTQIRQELNRMTFDHASKGIENPLLIGETKKEIARLLTELRSREVKSMTPSNLPKDPKLD